MKPCEYYQSKFVEALYNELTHEHKEEFETHLRSCTECASAFHDFEITLRVMNNRKDTTPDETYWNNYWNRLSTSLQEDNIELQERTVIPLQPFYKNAWTYDIAAILLIGIGLFVGKLLFGEKPEAASTIAQQENNTQAMLVKADVDKQAHTYLQRSKVMLLGLVNSDDASMGFSREQKISRSLLQQASDLKPRMIEPDQQRIKQLIDELEVILLQLANFEEQSDLPAIELIKKGVDEKAISLKINMEEMRAMSKSDTTTKKQLNKQKSNL